MGRYLGFKFKKEKSLRYDLSTNLEAMKQKVLNWNTTCLSLARRHVLTQFVLQVIPAYTVQVSDIPKGICEDMNRICQNFLWGSVQDQKHTHLLKWNSICLRKELGHKMETQSEAFQMKLAWKIYKNED